MAESRAILDIFNLALGHIGQRPITNANDSEVCQLYYPYVRDKILSWAPWTFATTRLELAKLAAPPASGFQHQYAIPTYPYMLRALDSNFQRSAYQVELYYPTPTAGNPQPEPQRVILTNVDPLILKYITRSPETVWPPMFQDTTALWLAVNIAQRSTDKTSLRQQLYTELDAQLTRMQDVDGHQDTAKRAILNEEYVYVRQTGTALYAGGPLDHLEDPRLQPDFH